MSAWGQDVSLVYSQTFDADMVSRLSLKLDKKSYMRITVKSDFSRGASVYLQGYRCRKGVVGEETFPFRVTIYPEERDSLVLEVLMQQLQDSVSLAFGVDGEVEDLGVPSRYRLPYKNGQTCSLILMETCLDTPLTQRDEIPLFAITSGICKEIEYEGQQALLQDFCGLRDKHINPSQWCQVEGVGDYFYYTLVFKE